MNVDLGVLRMVVGLLGAAALVSILGIVAAQFSGHPADPDLAKICFAALGSLGTILVNVALRGGTPGAPTVTAQVSPGMPPGVPPRS